VLIADHISEQFQKLRDSYRLTQIQIGQFAGLNVYLSRFGSEVNGSIGMSISSGYEFNVDCHNPLSSLLHVVRNAIAAKLTTAQETLERAFARTPDLAKARQSAVRSTSDIPRKSKSVRVSQATV